MCGGELGLHLLFIPEEYGGLGGGAYDIYRVSRGHGRHRPGHRDRRAGHLPGQRPDHGRRHARAEEALDGPDRRGRAAGGLRRHRAAGRQRPGSLRTTAEPVVRRRQADAATGSPAASSGSATAAWPICTRSWPSRPAARPGSSSRRARRASRRASPRTSTASAPATPPPSILEDVYRSGRPPGRRRRGAGPDPGAGRSSATPA